jgi:hypothetical protein
MELQMATFSAIQLLTQTVVYYKQKFYQYLQNVLVLIVYDCFMFIGFGEVEEEQRRVGTP